MRKAGITVLLVAISIMRSTAFAQKSYETGTLVDIEESKDTSLYQGTSVNTYFENYTVRIGDYQYQAWCVEKLITSRCNIGFTVGAEIKVRFDKSEIFLLRADGKEQKAHIEKRVKLGSEDAAAESNWHPNPAEDNREATWEETANFLTNLINSQGERRRNLAATLGPGSFLLEYDVRTPSKCMVEEKELRFSSRDKTLASTIWTIDLSRVDAQSILVRESEEGHWEVALWGINGEGLGSSNGAIRHGVGEEEIDNGIPDGLKEASCDLGEHACQPITAKGDKDSETFGDLETAKRAARAFLHASLLCSGPKPMSPF